MKEVKIKELRRATRKSAAKIVVKLPFTRTNYLLFGLGILLIIAGYVALAQPPVDGFWTLTVAPILLVIGYCVVIPVAILYQSRSSALPDHTKGDGR
ncbi:MAG: hypothetical protein ONB48_13965 [candidate division KSB1 bacterium]|nr:hypothetical protein [candidate division KSB1 bacterium]MDZ7276466.1 hypothetical protein [candidate division KSB1 bacterium]MDZ7286753.1 hypothetical protein [candidate division KSB1 bacterium]MDZ7300236.1 hypothetical protein [candidate division KSB1 bacterium]MDZ7306742.1 hypothetical protein [candidate division KSB1 bacterium]